MSGENTKSEKYWHCIAKKKDGMDRYKSLNMTLSEVKRTITAPFRNSTPFVVGRGLFHSKDDVDEIEIVHTEDKAHKDNIRDIRDGSSHTYELLFE